MTNDLGRPPGQIESVASTADLFHACYGELRKLAQRQLRGRRRPQTLNVTALVNEAFIKLSGRGWSSEEHFLRTASRAVRQIVIDHARHHGSFKRGSEFQRVTLNDAENHPHRENVDVDMVQLDAALTELEERNPQLAQLVELRYFCGLTIEETAKLLGVSASTVKREWAFARAWLFDRMQA